MQTFFQELVETGLEYEPWDIWMLPKNITRKGERNGAQECKQPKAGGLPNPQSKRRSFYPRMEKS